MVNGSSPFGQNASFSSDDASTVIQAVASLNQHVMWRRIGIRLRQLSCWILFSWVLIAGCTPRVSSYELLDEAQSALRLKNHPKARQLLDELLRRNPADSQARLFRAQLARDMDDDPAALKFLEKIPDSEPKLATKARFLEGSIYLAMNQARQAESQLKRSIELDPAFLPARERLVRFYALQCRKTDLLEQLQGLADHRLLNFAELVLQMSPDERVIGAKEAIPQLEAYLLADQDDLASRLALSIHYIEASRSHEGIAILKDLLVRDPDSHMARATLADVYIDQHDLEEAGRVLDGVVLTESSPLDLWRSGGAYLLATEQWQTAAQCFAFVVSRDSLDRQSFNLLATALQRLGLNPLAEAAFTRTAELARLKEQLEKVGILFMRQQLDVKDVIAVAELLSSLNEPDRASIWYERALQIVPNNAEARNGLARLQLRPASSLTQLLKNVPQSSGSITLHASKSQTPSANSTSASVTSAGSTIQFRDDHESTGLGFTYFNGAMGFRYLIESMGGGTGVIDFDADGWPDLFFTQGHDLKPEGSANTGGDQLYRNLGGEHFLAVPPMAGVADPGYGQGIAVGDFDNDGFDDLFIANFDQSSVLHNQGDGTFQTVSDATGLSRIERSSSAGWADFDQDGLLDLFVVNYVDSLKVCYNDRGEIATCSPSTHQGIDDRVYRNLGDGRFEDVSSTCGLVPEGKGLGLLLADLDDDGRIDAFVANDTTPNFFYRNHSSPGRIQFVEEGLLSGVALSDKGIAQAGMGIACGDLNGDQRLDLYVTYFYREANGLYLNDGSGAFHDAARTAQLYQPTMEKLGFGTQAVDFDLDGRLELFVANGHIDDQRKNGIPWKMSPQLFVPRGTSEYVDRSAEAGDYFLGEYLGRSVVHLDWNRDGRRDLAVVHQDRPVALLTNITDPHGQFFEIQLRAVSANRNAIGARISLTSGKQTQRADITSGDGFFCSNERTIQFGLGNSQQVDRVEIRWPDGQVEIHEKLPSGSRWLAIQGQKFIPLSR